MSQTLKQCALRGIMRHTEVNTLKTLIELHDWRKTTHNCRVMVSARLLFLLSAHTRPIYPTHFAGSPYTARITATITPI